MLFWVFVCALSFWMCVVILGFYILPPVGFLSGLFGIFVVLGFISSLELGCKIVVTSRSKVDKK